MSEPSSGGGGRLSGLQLLGAASAVYGLAALLGSLALFTHTAFGPILLGPGGARPPAPPLELRWHVALLSIMNFALSVLLLVASFGTVRRMRRAALMLGLWSVSAIFVHAISLAWSFTLGDDAEAYQRRLVAAEMHAVATGHGTPEPLGEYEEIYDACDRIGRAMHTVAFAYPAFVGLMLLLPPSRRRIASWN